MEKLLKRTVSMYVTVIQIRRNRPRNWSLRRNLVGDLISKETESSYWDGFIRGFVPPGTGDWFSDEPAPMHWESDDEVIFTFSNPLYDTEVRGGRYPVFETESPTDQAYWMGYVAGLAAFSAVISSFVFVAAAETGFIGSLAFAAGAILEVTAPVTVPVVGVTALTAVNEYTRKSIGSRHYTTPFTSGFGTVV